MRNDRVWGLLTLALLTVFVLVAGLVARDVIAARPPESVPVPVAAAESLPLPAPTGTDAVDPVRLADSLDDPMARSGISEGLSAYVVDAATREELYARDVGDAVVPASTTKVVTGVAVLHAVGPDARLTTEVVRGASADEIVLVGGGDPTLTDADEPGGYPRSASLVELAEATARTLRKEGTDSVRLGYDDSAFTGSSLGPGWKPSYVTEGSTAPVHALMVDGARIDPAERYGPRHGDPPRAAAEAFARRLGEAGVSVTGPPSPVRAAAGAEVLADVASPPMSVLVEETLLSSDNNLAEALARQVALARGAEPDFAGAADATSEVLAELGVGNVRLKDGSGLSVDNEVTAEALVELLLLATDPRRPELYPVISGLPTAHATGSLDDRYAPTGSASAGAGLVRAKTGTLNGVRALAGTAVTANGRPVVFAFVANHPGARGSLLDVFAAALTECAC